MTAARVPLTRHERRCLARARGRGLWAKRIPATLPRRTVEVMRVAISFIEPYLRRS